ncbi:hypothetical protein KY312_02300 [Candidatus Woesearchaeota archaeon]|nr:hypothetical protein [Candidatus Woesearchaeota archaeon]
MEKKYQVRIDSCNNLEQPAPTSILKDGIDWAPDNEFIDNKFESNEGNGFILYKATMADVPEELRKDREESDFDQYKYNGNCKLTGQLCPFLKTSKFTNSFSLRNEPGFKRCPGYERFEHIYQALFEEVWRKS